MNSARTYHQAPDQLTEPPPGCPVHRTFTPLDDDYLEDPYPIADALREELGVFYAAPLGHVVVTKMEDVEHVFMNPDVFASTNVQDPIYPLAPEAAEILSAPDFDPVAVMSNRSEPDHGRIRAYTRQGFGNRRLRALEDYMRSRASDLLDSMLAAGPPAEFVSALAFPLPAEIVFRFLGFPPEDDAMIKSWCVNRRAFSWGRPTPAEQVEIAQGMLDYWRYCREFVGRAPRPSDRRLHLRATRCLGGRPRAGSRPGRHHRHLLPGGRVGGLRDQLRRPRPGHRPAVQHPALPPPPPRPVAGPGRRSVAGRRTGSRRRCATSRAQVSWRRIATRPTTSIGGVEVPAGTRIFLNFASANHEPERVRGSRARSTSTGPSAGRHISFGKGIHFCLGSGLAKMEARLVLDLLAARVPSLRLVEGQDLDYFPNITFRGPSALLVEWDT